MRTSCVNRREDHRRRLAGRHHQYLCRPVRRKRVYISQRRCKTILFIPNFTYTLLTGLLKYYMVCIYSRSWNRVPPLSKACTLRTGLLTLNRAVKRQNKKSPKSRHIIHGKVRVTIWRVRDRVRWVTIWYFNMNHLPKSQL